MKNQASAWLIEKRKAQNLSLRQLGAKTGLSHVTIANAEDGNATTDTWIKLAEHFETNPQLILSWVNKMEPLPEADQWVIETQRGLAKLPPASRRVVEVLIQALRKEEQRKE